MLRVVLRLVVCALFLALATTCSHAQFSGTIQGIVTDSSGAVVAGASVELRNVETGVTQTTATTDSGNYAFNNLQPGDYVMTVSAKGFKNTEVKLTVSTAQLEGINVTLPLASVSTSATVTFEPPPVDTEDTRIETTLDNQLTRDLPTVNRNLWDVLAVQPGVVGVGTRGAGESPGGLPDNFGTQTPQISANGRSYTGNVVFVDGMNVTSPVQNGNIILAPIPDAVQEASLQTNTFDAEDNLGSSVLIQVTTKSGTNQFHGSGDLFFTNQDLQALEYPNTAVAPFSRKDLVGTFGGPAIKNKLFFFADVEKLWAKNAEEAGTATWDDPAFDTWANTNFPSNVGTQAIQKYPPTFLHAVGAPETAQTYAGSSGASSCSGGPTFTYTALNGMTIPNVPCSLAVRDSGTFLFSPYYNALQYNFRGDYYFTTNDRLYLSYYNDSFDQQQPYPRSGLASVDIMRNRYGQVDYTHTFNANLLLEGAFAFASVGGANGQPVSGQNLSVPWINVNDGTTGYNIGGGWGPGEYRGPNYNWRAVLSWVRGAHTFKFGYQGDHAIEHGDFSPYNVRPIFSFNNLFDLVLDNPVSETVNAYNPLTGNAGYVLFGGQENPFGFYAEDNWKLSSRLTLTLALRWDDFTNHTPWGGEGCGAPANECFRFSDIFVGAGTTIEQQIAGASVVQRRNGLFSGSQDNYWSPRIGVAWDPIGDAKWVIRGGVGVYRDWIALGQSVDQMRNNPPSVLSETFIANGFAGATAVQPDFAFGANPTYPFNFPLPAIPALTLNSQGGYNSNGVPLPTNVDSLAPNLIPPLAVNYVVGVEHQLPGQFVASASYSGSRSYDGLTGSDWNRCAGCAIRPNADFATMTYVTNSNRATYNALILAVKRNAARRGSFQASYTLSHAQDFPEAGTRFDQDGGLGIPDQSAYFSYWGDANWDVRQRFSFSGIYNIPGMKEGIGKIITDGWEISSLAAVQTGTPFWVVCANSSSCDYNGDLTYYDIPDIPSTDFTGSHSRDAYKTGIFTSADFPIPTLPNTEGNLPRNIYRNPGYFQVDASVIKNTHVPWLGDAGNFQLRFEFLNVFNVNNLGAVDGNLADCQYSAISQTCLGTFGKSPAALPAREIELGARIAF